ncbi:MULTISPECIES: hypothetical protein [unclassified Thiocapsa]|uniref:hypothetical protein n=1 Tax=unclassified Thiocapsa TaxID=2641286 RepID=UPI0035B4C4DE
MRLEIDRPRLLETRHRREDGSVFPSKVSVCAYGSREQPRYRALLRDVSRRKEADAAIERLAVMGELVAMIIHQLRNPLATINLCLGRCRRCRWYVRRIAQAHHWRFSLSWTSDEGTVARLTL